MSSLSKRQKKNLIYQLAFTRVNGGALVFLYPIQY